MKLLVTCLLEDIAVVSHLKPLSMLDNVSEILVVRDTKGPKIDKVKYYSLCPIFRLPIIRVIAKLLLMIYIGFFKRSDFIHSVFIRPHGTNAIIASKILRKPVSVALIGSDVRYKLSSKVIGKVYLGFLKKADAVFVLGDNARTFLLEKGIDRNKIFESRLYLDLSKFSPKSVPKKYDLVFVGRFHPVKRIDLFLKLVSELKKKKKDISAVIIGDGALRMDLEKLSGKLEIQDNITFAGFRKNIADYLNKSRLFVMTSDSEGLPVAMIEAMCSGVVPVVPDVGEITSIAKDNVNSIIINPNESREAADKIIKLLDDKKKYEKLAKNAAKIREEYSASKLISSWKKVFRKCLGGSIEK